VDLRLPLPALTLPSPSPVVVYLNSDSIANASIEKSLTDQHFFSNTTVLHLKIILPADNFCIRRRRSFRHR